MIGEEVIAVYGDAGDGEELFEVQKLVRCKECYHGTDIKNGKMFCIRCDIMDDLLMIADGFCNFGEREGE